MSVKIATIGVLALLLVACTEEPPSTGNIRVDGTVQYYLNNILLKEVNYKTKTVKHHQTDKLIEKVKKAKLIEHIHYLKIPSLIYRDNIETLYGIPSKKVCKDYSISYSYTGKGLLSKITYEKAGSHKKDIIFTLKYDTSGRIIEATSEEESDTQTYEYGFDGNLLSAGKVDNHTSQLYGGTRELLSLDPLIVHTEVNDEASKYRRILKPKLGRIYYDKKEIKNLIDSFKLSKEDLKKYEKVESKQSLLTPLEKKKLFENKENKLPLTLSSLGLFESLLDLNPVYLAKSNLSEKFELIWEFRTKHLKNRQLEFDDLGRVEQERFPNNPELECQISY